MIVWKVSVESRGIACGGRGARRGCRPINLKMVRYTDCGACAVELKRKYGSATIEDIETDDLPEGFELHVCREHGAQETSAAAESPACH